MKNLTVCKRELKTIIESERVYKNYKKDIEEKEASYRFILIHEKFEDTSDTMAATSQAEYYSA